MKCLWSATTLSDAKEVCSNGRFKGNVWKGPPRHLIRGKFERWARNLEQGAKFERRRRPETGEHHGGDLRGNQPMRRVVEEHIQDFKPAKNVQT